MERVHGADKAPKLASEDVITKMPENVITSILDRLPIRDAVGTSILSKNWRFKWTMLTQLVFNEELSEYGKSISRLLMHIKGPITKFFLYLPDNIVLDVEDINHWVLVLSRKGIEELSIINMHETPLKLPTHIFSLLELKHLKLRNCYLHSVPPDCGFPNIISLDLYRVTFGSGGCWKLITQCHLVEILKISYHEPVEKVKLAEIATLKNLKVLSLPFRKLDNTVISCSDIFELGGFLPKLEAFNLDFRHCKFLREIGIRKWVLTAFPCLKILTINPIDLYGGSMLCAFEIYPTTQMFSGENGKLLFATKLLTLHRASPEAEIKLC